jgi:hypothetical protein
MVVTTVTSTGWALFLTCHRNHRDTRPQETVIFLVVATPCFITRDRDRGHRQEKYREWKIQLPVQVASDPSSCLQQCRAHSRTGEPLPSGSVNPVTFDIELPGALLWAFSTSSRSLFCLSFLP